MKKWTKTEDPINKMCIKTKIPSNLKVKLNFGPKVKWVSGFWSEPASFLKKDEKYNFSQNFSDVFILIKRLIFNYFVIILWYSGVPNRLIELYF